MLHISKSTFFLVLGAFSSLCWLYLLSTGKFSSWVVQVKIWTKVLLLTTVTVYFYKLCLILYKWRNWQHMNLCKDCQFPCGGNSDHFCTDYPIPLVRIKSRSLYAGFVNLGWQSCQETWGSPSNRDWENISWLNIQLIPLTAFHDSYVHY